MPIKRVNKCIVIGLDAPVPKLIKRYVAEGKLPALGSLIERGVFAENCLVPFPTITPPNWTTIVTGAKIGTHGISCFVVHNPGDPLDVTHQGFLSDDCQAEYIWDSAEKAGKRTVVFNYPSTWPPTMKNGIQVGGAGLSVNEWRVGRSLSGGPHSRAAKVPNFCLKICGEQLFATEEFPFGQTIELEEATGWRNVPSSHARDLEAEIPFYFPASEEDVVEEVLWYILVQDGSGDGYDRVLLSKSKDDAEQVAELRIGQWSDTITMKAKTDQGERKGIFRAKLLELSPDGEDVKLFFTGIAQIDGYTVPESVADELSGVEGLPIPGNLFVPFNLGWVDVDTCLEMWNMTHEWYGNAVVRILEKHPWDLFFMHAHCTDWLGHAILTKADPIATRDADTVRVFEDMMEKLYQSVDVMIGRMLEVVDKNTLVIVVSDHGAVATGPHVPVNDILAQRGLLAYKEGSDGGQRTINWSKTKAVAQRSTYVYVNLKGRDPDGIVEPEQYDGVVQQVIDALVEYVEPETGRRPFSLVVKKSDARMIGLYGDRVGDVIYAIHPEFGGQHGQHLPTAEYGIGSLRGLLIMSGPNIKKNHVLERNVGLEDIVPTICHLMDLPVPTQAEGAIIYQAFTDPNFKLKEKDKLAQNYQKLKETYEAEIALTHAYNR